MKILNKHFGAILTFLLLVIMTYAGLVAYKSTLSTGKGLLEEFGNALRNMLANLLNGSWLGNLAKNIKDFFSNFTGILLHPFQQFSNGVADVGATVGAYLPWWTSTTPPTSVVPNTTPSTTNGQAQSIQLGFGSSELFQATNNSTYVDPSILNQDLHPAFGTTLRPPDSGDTELPSATQTDNTNTATIPITGFSFNKNGYLNGGDVDIRPVDDGSGG